jgi:hypothetical protein
MMLRYYGLKKKTIVQRQTSSKRWCHLRAAAADTQSKCTRDSEVSLEHHGEGLCIEVESLRSGYFQAVNAHK